MSVFRNLRLPSARTLFLASTVFLLIVGMFSYGFIAGYFRLFPYNQVRHLDAIYEDFRNWRAIFGIRPDNYLYRNSATFGIETDPSITERDDLVFLSGFIDGDIGHFLIERDGTIVHRWVANYYDVWTSFDHIYPPDLRPATNWHVSVHGSQPLPDGSVVFNHADTGLVRMDRCGRVLWTLPRMTHHSVSRAEDGTFWVSDSLNDNPDPDVPGMRAAYWEPLITQVSEDGEILRTISVARALVDGGYPGVLFPTGDDVVRNVAANFEHLNDVEALPSRLESVFPMFNAGDLIVSLRNLNAIVVIDTETERAKWTQVGPWLRQHDPEFLDDGRLVVFDNNHLAMAEGDSFEGSRLIGIDPLTRDWTVIFGGSGDEFFFTPERGKVQPTAHGTLVAVVASEGRAFEIDLEGNVLWEYLNNYNDTFRATLWEAIPFPRDYFEPGAIGKDGC